MWFLLGVVCGAALFALWSAFDTITQYADREIEEIDRDRWDK